MQNRFPGLQIVIGGAGDHLPKVDSKIRRIKEVCRCVKSELEWTLPKGLVQDLVKYGTSRTNIRRTKAAKTNTCPRVKFTGQKVNYKQELALAFGDYIEAKKPRAKSNTLDDWTEPCIALYPLSNFSGSWKVYNILTKRKVRRSNLKKCVVTDLVKSQMNLLSKGGRVARIQDTMEEDPAEKANVDHAGRLLCSDVSEDSGKEETDKGSVLMQMSVKKGILKHGK